MIITSTQQIEEIINPSCALDLSEFENITLKFGSFICISKKKKFNFLNFLKFVIEDKRTQNLYFKMLGEDNLQIVLRAYINCTPNLYKKIFRSKLNKKRN